MGLAGKVGQLLHQFLSILNVCIAGSRVLQTIACRERAIRGFVLLNNLLQGWRDWGDMRGR